MRISDWSSDVCSSDLPDARDPPDVRVAADVEHRAIDPVMMLANFLDHQDMVGKIGLQRRAEQLAEDGQVERGGDRKSVVKGKSVSVRVDLGGRRIIKKKMQIQSGRQCMNN